jgi:hypothetical protein
MAKTYGELILECENFKYSNENYELTKECYELSLMAQYIESQQYVMNNISDIHEEYKEFDESFFVESVSEDGVDAIIESADEKSKNIFKRIWNGLKRIWKKICGFFSRLFGKSKKTSEKNKKVKELLESQSPAILAELIDVALEVSDDIKPEENKELPKVDHSAALKCIIEEAWKDEYKNDGFVIADNQPYAKEIHIKSLHTKKNAYLLNMLAAALSDSSIVIRTNGEKKIISIERLVYIFEDVISKSNGSDISIDKLKSDFDSAIKNANSNGVIIVVEPTNVDRINNTLNEIRVKLDEFMKESTDEISDDNVFTEKSVAQKKREKKAAQQAAGGAKPRENNRSIKNMDDYNKIANDATALKEVYSELMAVTGNMMKLYNDIENYRAAVGNGLMAYMESKKISDKA